MSADGGIRFGNYVLLRRLARGGMAEVFLAQQRGLEGFDRRVALKRILPHLADSQDFVKMFLGEAKLAAQLTHPNVVHIYEFGKVDRDYFIAMEYVEGVHAGELFKQTGRERMTPTLIARLGADAATALHYAHELRGPSGQPFGLVHRDVSPANLMISYDGVVKLCDFGIAKAVALTDQKTSPGQVKGKYAYMSPEQTVGTQLDGRSDVFSLAIVLWELLAGKTIVPRGDPIAAMRAIRDGRLVPIAEVAPGVPPPLAAAIGWALATRREDRATAAQLATALEAFIKGSPELATPMQLGAWVRLRFPRDAFTGPERAIADDPSAGPGTLASPATAGGTASGPTAAGRVLPVTPLPPRRPAADDLDDNSETLSVDPEVGAETIFREEWARPQASRLAARDPAPARPAPAGHAASAASAAPAPPAPHQNATVLEDPRRLAAAPAAPPDRPTLAAYEPARTPDEEPTLYSKPRHFPPPEPSPHPPSQPAPHPPSQPDAHLPSQPAPLLPSQPDARARSQSAPPPWLADSRSPPGGTRPPFGEARPPGAPLGTGFEPAARPRIPRQFAVFGGLAGIAIMSFVISLVVCSPQREAAPPDAPVAAATVDAGAATPASGAGADAAPADAAPAPAPPDAGPQLQVYKVDTRPAGGTVQIGDERHAAPAQLMLPPGKHTVVAELDGWEPETRTIEIVDGVDLTNEIQLTRRVPASRGSQTGLLTVRTTPYSDVYIGTRKIGQSPFSDKEVPAGTYSLTFKNPLHPTVRKQVTILPGKLYKLPPFTLPPSS